MQHCSAFRQALSYVKVKFNGELERRALIDTGAFANVISREFYKELINTNINSITEIEKPDLDKVKMANGNIVKIDKAIKVTFKLGAQTFTEDFLVLIVTTPVILGKPFFVKHKVGICPGQSDIKFPDQTLQINEIKPEKQPRRVVKRKKFGVYTQKSLTTKSTSSIRMQALWQTRIIHWPLWRNNSKRNLWKRQRSNINVLFK